VLQTLFSHISINSSTIYIVLITQESPCKKPFNQSQSCLEAINIGQAIEKISRQLITNGHLLFVMGALILQRVQKCEVRQVTKDVVKSEV